MASNFDNSAPFVMTASAHPETTWRHRFVTRALIVYWAILFTGTHVPKLPWERLTPKDGFFFLSDKWQHYLGYTILAVLLAAWWSTRRRLTVAAAALLWTVIVAYGYFDEFTQPFFGRDYDLLDWRADAIGGLTGLICCAIALRFFGRDRSALAIETNRG
jgi:VanZ family protein